MEGYPAWKPVWWGHFVEIFSIPSQKPFYILINQPSHISQDGSEL